MKILNVERGSKSDVLYLQISNHPISHSFELSPDIIIDLDKDNGVVGIDVQNVTGIIADHAQPFADLYKDNKSMKLQLVATSS